MKILIIGSNGECEACCKEDMSGGGWEAIARWGDYPRSFECQGCAETSTEWEVEIQPGMTAPDEPRDLTTEELRAIGWGVEGDSSCSTCGLYTMDGEFPLCEECGDCEECAGDLRGDGRCGGCFEQEDGPQE